MYVIERYLISVDTSKYGINTFLNPFYLKLLVNTS